MNRNLLIGVLLAGAVSIGTLFTWPTFQDYQVVSSQLNDREVELENRATYFQDLQTASETLAGFPNQLVKVEASIPDQPNLPSLYNVLQQEASLSGLSLGSISATIEQGQDGSDEMKVIPVTLQLTGSYTAIKEFLGRLQTGSRITSIQTLNVTGSVQSGIFTATVQVQAYSY